MLLDAWFWVPTQVLGHVLKPLTQGVADDVEEYIREHGKDFGPAR